LIKGKTKSIFFKYFLFFVNLFFSNFRKKKTKIVFTFTGYRIQIIFPYHHHADHVCRVRQVREVRRWLPWRGPPTDYECGLREVHEVGQAGE